VVFKRRNKRTVFAWARQLVYPIGGFARAGRYMLHRMRRLPDEPHRIARGVFAGTFVNFPPIFGIQFLSAGLLAWAMRGNILAALLCTFLSNPITTPIIAVTSLELGHWMLGIDAPLDIRSIFGAFADAGGELWRNFKAIFTDERTHWDNLYGFFRRIYLPYFVGSIIPGIIFSTILYGITIPGVKAYQKLRANKSKERSEKRSRLRAALAEASALLKARKENGDDDGASAP
jgi:uncharacterized protein